MQGQGRNMGQYQGQGQGQGQGPPNPFGPNSGPPPPPRMVRMTSSGNDNVSFIGVLLVFVKAIMCVRSLTHPTAVHALDLLVPIVLCCVVLYYVAVVIVLLWTVSC